MGKKAAGAAAGTQEKGKNDKEGTAKTGRRCFNKCTIAIFVAIIALCLGVEILRNTVTDILVLGFLYARYWHEGIPLESAWKDAVYFRASGGMSLTFIRHFMEMANIYDRQLLHVEPGDDHITALCKVSMYTQMVTAATWTGVDPLMPPGFFNFDTFDPVPTQERVNSYLQACIEVYNGLDKDGKQRQILDTLEPKRKVQMSSPTVLTTNEHVINKGKMDRFTEAAKRPSHADKWKPINEIPDYGFMFQGTNIRPVREEVIDASEIPEAVRQGKVAVFDATKLLGKEIFNLTMADIGLLHKDLAKNIPMYRQKGASAPGRSGIESLETYGLKTGIWKKENAIRFPENAPWRPAGYVEPKDKLDWDDAYKQPTWWLEVMAKVVNPWFNNFVGLPIQEILRQIRSMSLQCAINTRRLPNLPMPKIEDALGNPDWLERAWTMFWLGPVADCWHYDDPDNLLIGIYGDIWVTVFKLKDRELMRGGADRGCWSPLAPMPSRIDTPYTQQQDGWLEKFEFIHLKLTPGTGVVVPSGAFHSLTMVDGDRILMNCFMIPKYKGLWDAPAAKYSFYNSTWQSEEYHALSQLKKSSIFRLWDTKKLGGYFEGAKLEML